MPDITMCKGEGCPDDHKLNCYRFTATEDTFYQMYFTDAPYNPETEECEYFKRDTRTIKGNRSTK